MNKLALDKELMFKAIKEAKKYGNVNIAASSADVSYKKYPAPESWNLNQKSDYLHLVMNETIDGVCLRDLNNLYTSLKLSIFGP